MSTKAPDRLKVEFSRSQLETLQGALEGHCLALVAKGFRPADEIYVAKQNIADALNAAPEPITYTAFCQQASGGGTIWISTVAANDVDEACDVARDNCAADWEYEPEDVHVLGLASGDVTIEYWEDIDG